MMLHAEAKNGHPALPDSRDVRAATDIAMIDPNRGTGRTLAQLEAMPLHSIFVWCTSEISYPRSLADRLERQDIRIAPASVFEDGAERLRGLQRGQVVVDHAFLGIATDSQREGYRLAREMRVL